MQLIGTGMFSKVYKMDEKRVFIKSVCYSKECLSLFIDSPVFPKIKKVEYQEYICEYYPKVKSLKNELLPKYYEVYKELRNLSIGYNINPHYTYNEWRKQFKTVKNKQYRTALIDALEELTNYGTDICFEISPRNVAVKNGKLILLDVFFFRSQADEIRTSKKQKKW